MFIDYYEILEIPPGSHETMIKDAYEKQLNKFVAVNDLKQVELLHEIYNTLMSVETRINYDDIWLKNHKPKHKHLYQT